MKGLILKDLIALRKQGKIALLLIGFYAVYAFVTKNSSMLGAMAAVLCTMLPITTLSYDEFNKWDRYALTLPIRRRTVVQSKYVLGVMMNVAATILVTIVSIILMPFMGDVEIGEILTVVAVTGMASLVLLAVILPLLFKFGVEKGRMLMMGVVFLPTMLVILLGQMGIPAPDPELLKLFGYASPVLAACLLLISYNISSAIYQKKEF